MKSIKPGRGPSMMSGIASLAVGVFGIVWTFAAASMGAPGFFSLFGVFFVLMAVVSGIYNIRNATAEQRYSAFDITDGSEEADPLNQHFGAAPEQTDTAAAQSDGRFCPYCGASVEEDYSYCRQCGKKL